MIKNNMLQKFSWIFFLLTVIEVKASNHAGWFFIKNKPSGLVLNVGPMGIDRPWPRLGGHIIIWYKNGEDSQLWKWKGNTIANELGYVLDVEGEKNWVIASEPNGEKSQEWMMVGDKIISALNGMALDTNVFCGSQVLWCKPGTRVIIWPLKDYGNQSWELEYI